MVSKPGLALLSAQRWETDEDAKRHEEVDSERERERETERDCRISGE